MRRRPPDHRAVLNRCRVRRVRPESLSETPSCGAVDDHPVGPADRARDQSGVALVRGGDPGPCLLGRLSELDVARDEAFDPLALVACDEPDGVNGAAGPWPGGAVEEPIGALPDDQAR